MGKISEHDRRLRSRLILITPFVLLAHALALATLARVDLLQDRISVGYKGPPKYEPEISIIDDRTSESVRPSREQRVLVVQNVFIEGEDVPRPARSSSPARKSAPRPVDQELVVPSPGEATLRTYPSHAAVPYREDYVILKMVRPVYPEDAVANLEEGWVLVEAYVDARGAVNEAYVRSSLGPRSFEAASLDAVRQFLFRSVEDDGKPVSFWVSFLVRFQLRR